MKTLLFKITLLAILAAPVTVSGSNGTLQGKYVKEKTIQKEYNVNSNALLKVSNSYGTLSLTSWNEDRVVIEVNIKTSGNNEDKVQDRLNEITVDFEASPEKVSAKTQFGNKAGSWWKWGKKNKISIQVNYTIKLPVKNSIHLSNDYGAIELDRIDGHAKISCDYGRLEIGELRGRNNELSFDYTSKSRIDYVNSAKIAADYSKFTIGKAKDLQINADYTAAVIEKMDNLEYASDYGSLEVMESNNVLGSGDYFNLKLGTVHGSVDSSADYGSIKIDRMAADAGNINIKSDYTSIRIGYDPAYSFDFEISASNAGVKGTDNFEVSVSREKDKSRYYAGYHGQANSGNLVNITSDYGNISFNRN
ncbi:hypothetical protein [Lentiprolixibacter aurantiacus]|uniref:Adhesin domain-containing protein n=1 Tax=Lentiprolixibacter aurantiacus TaxID=2993939 RepID=A0AAE3MM68_9FLAO|nr:hypothetical protein [Lentiprolixibacter aurantiacus]MCX2719968.1 hypothetical protein [Lentiprolixibacter aurantiacus]